MTTLWFQDIIYWLQLVKIFSTHKHAHTQTFILSPIQAGGRKEQAHKQLQRHNDFLEEKNPNKNKIILLKNN